MNIEELAVAVALLEPELPTARILAAIDRAAPRGQDRVRLLRHVECVPDALSTGHSGAPPPVARLITLLLAEGAQRVREPRCAECDRMTNLRYRRGSERVCVACQARAKSRLCSRCRRNGRIAAMPGGEAVCDRCWRHDPASWKKCILCERVGTGAKRTEQGVVCKRCYERPPHRCGRCGDLTEIHSRKNGENVCDVCYRVPERTCGSCGEVALIRSRAKGIHDLDLCGRCYQLPPVDCTGCGRHLRCPRRGATGPLCQSCAPRPVHLCAVCGRSRPAQKIGEDGPICSTCYGRQHRRVCTDCGILATPYEAVRCQRCTLKARLRKVLAAEPGGTQVAPQLAPVYDVMVSAGHPVSLLGWLRCSAGPDILRALATGSVALDHNALDELPRSGALYFVRNLLVATGVLPERAEHLARLNQFLDELLREVDAEQAHAVRMFAHWSVFRRLQFRADRDPSEEVSTKTARSSIRRALEFLVWLRGEGKALAACRQEDVDTWLAGGSTTRYQVRDFLEWARRRSLTPALVAPTRQVLAPASSIDDEERWTFVERLLDDEEIGLEFRVAGLFVVVFGQQLSRVARMRATAVELDGDRVRVRFGNEPVLLPGAIGHLVRRLLNHRSPAAYETDAGRRWLFPGGAPGRPIAPEYLRIRLAEQGVSVRPLRNAALMQIAGEVVSPILADLLDLHPSTASRWVKAAKGDWAEYVGERAAQGPR